MPRCDRSSTKFGEQLQAALTRFFADVAGYLWFFLQLVEGRFEFGVNFEQAAILCGQRIGVHFQNLVRSHRRSTNARASPVWVR